MSAQNGARATSEEDAAQHDGVLPRLSIDSVRSLVHFAAIVTGPSDVTFAVSVDDALAVTVASIQVRASVERLRRRVVSHARLTTPKRCRRYEHRRSERTHGADDGFEPGHHRTVVFPTSTPGRRVHSCRAMAGVNYCNLRHTRVLFLGVWHYNESNVASQRVNGSWSWCKSPFGRLCR